MAKSFKTRLAAIDAQIIDVQYLYQRELDREANLEPTRRHLLASRGFKYRLDNLYARRLRLRRAAGAAPTQAENYAVEMSRRNTEYLDACDELERVTRAYANTLARITLVGLNTDNELELKCIRREIGAKKSIVYGKYRAVENWSKKGSATLDNRAIKKLERPAPTALPTFVPAFLATNVASAAPAAADVAPATLAVDTAGAADIKKDLYASGFAALQQQPEKESEDA